ncbi:hypothetical protein GCM10009814_03670 [Lapillicoccus jejuensis]
MDMSRLLSTGRRRSPGSGTRVAVRRPTHKRFSQGPVRHSCEDVDRVARPGRVLTIPLTKVVSADLVPGDDARELATRKLAGGRFGDVTAGTFDSADGRVFLLTSGARRHCASCCATTSTPSSSSTPRRRPTSRGGSGRRAPEGGCPGPRRTGARRRGRIGG